MTLMLERPEMMKAPDGPVGFQELYRLLVAMDGEMPDGYRVEIIWGSIVVSPWSKPYYALVMDPVMDQLRRHLPEGNRVGGDPFLYVFPGESRAYGPDIHVAAGKAFNVPAEQRHVDGEALSLVVELTSPATRDADWRDKLPVYGRAGVPVYLLIDMQERKAAVFWDPGPEGYRSWTEVPFGRRLRIPPPFDFDLDTAFDLPPEDSEDSEDSEGSEDCKDCKGSEDDA